VLYKGHSLSGLKTRGCHEALKGQKHLIILINDVHIVDTVAPIKKESVSAEGLKSQTFSQIDLHVYASN
jgi:hypothetical protein